MWTWVVRLFLCSIVNDFVTQVIDSPSAFCLQGHWLIQQYCQISSVKSHRTNSRKRISWVRRDKGLNKYKERLWTRLAAVTPPPLSCYQVANRNLDIQVSSFQLNTPRFLTNVWSIRPNYIFNFWLYSIFYIWVHGSWGAKKWRQQ